MPPGGVLGTGGNDARGGEGGEREDGNRAMFGRRGTALAWRPPLPVEARPSSHAPPCTYLADSECRRPPAVGGVVEDVETDMAIGIYVGVHR